MDLNNINLEDIKEKLLSIDKKTLIKYGSVVGAVILFLIIYYAILNPIVVKKRAQLVIFKFRKKLKKLNQYMKKIHLYFTLKKKLKDYIKH